MIVGPGVLASPEVCAAIRRALLDALAYETSRNGAPPATLARFVAEVDKVARQVAASSQVGGARRPGAHPETVRSGMVGPESAARLTQLQTARRPLTTAEAARVIGCSPRHVQRLAQRGRLTGRPVAGKGSAYEFDPFEVQAYAERHQGQKEAA